MKKKTHENTLCSVRPRFSQNSTEEKLKKDIFKMCMKMNKRTVAVFFVRKHCNGVFANSVFYFLFLTSLTEKLLRLLFFHLAKYVKKKILVQLGGYLVSNLLYNIIYTSTLIHFKYIFYFPSLYYLKGIL